MDAPVISFESTRLQGTENNGEAYVAHQDEPGAVGEFEDAVEAVGVTIITGYLGAGKTTVITSFDMFYRDSFALIRCDS